MVEIVRFPHDYERALFNNGEYSAIDVGLYYFDDNGLKVFYQYYTLVGFEKDIEKCVKDALEKKNIYIPKNYELIRIYHKRKTSVYDNDIYIMPLEHAAKKIKGTLYEIETALFRKEKHNQGGALEWLSE